MKRVTLILCLAICYNLSQAQTHELDTLLKTSKDRQADDNKKLITDSAYSAYLYNKFDGVSGTEVKAGKVFGTTATLDDKSATINFSFKPIAHAFYLQPTIAASATDGFTTIFSNNQYGKTLTGGFNFQLFFRRNFSGFDSLKRIQLHNQLRSDRANYIGQDKATVQNYFTKALTTVQAVLTEAGKPNTLLTNMIQKYDTQSIEMGYTDAADKIATKLYQDYRSNVDTLVKVGILDKGFSTKAIKEQSANVASCLNNNALVQVKSDAVAEKAYLSKAAAKQLAATFNYTYLHWLSGGFSYNHGNQDIADPASTKLVRTMDEEYVKANLAMNMLWTMSSGKRHYLSITANLSNAHDFKKADQITAESDNPYLIGSTTLNQVKKTYTFYPTVPGRVHDIYGEADYIFFNNRSNIGFEAAIKGGVHDPDDDNLGLRLGVFVPVGTKDNKPVLVEPLVRLTGLSNSLNDFMKDHFIVGFNITVKFSDYFF